MHVVQNVVVILEDDHETGTVRVARAIIKMVLSADGQSSVIVFSVIYGLFGFAECVVVGAYRGKIFTANQGCGTRYINFITWHHTDFQITVSTTV